MRGLSSFVALAALTSSAYARPRPDTKSTTTSHGDRKIDIALFLTNGLFPTTTPLKDADGFEKPIWRTTDVDVATAVNDLMTRPFFAARDGQSVAPQPSLPTQASSPPQASVPPQVSTPTQASLPPQVLVPPQVSMPTQVSTPPQVSVAPQVSVPRQSAVPVTSTVTIPMVIERGMPIEITTTTADGTIEFVSLAKRDELSTDPDTHPDPQCMMNGGIPCDTVLPKKGQDPYFHLPASPDAPCPVFYSASYLSETDVYKLMHYNDTDIQKAREYMQVHCYDGLHEDMLIKDGYMYAKAFRDGVARPITESMEPAYSENWRIAHNQHNNIARAQTAHEIVGHDKCEKALNLLPKPETDYDISRIPIAIHFIYYEMRLYVEEHCDGNVSERELASHAVKHVQDKWYKNPSVAPHTTSGTNATTTTQQPHDHTSTGFPCCLGLMCYRISDPSLCPYSNRYHIEDFLRNATEDAVGSKITRDVTSKSGTAGGPLRWCDLTPTSVGGCCGGQDEKPCPCSGEECEEQEPEEEQEDREWEEGEWQEFKKEMLEKKKQGKLEKGEWEVFQKEIEEHKREQEEDGPEVLRRNSTGWSTRNQDENRINDLNSSTAASRSASAVAAMADHRPFNWCNIFNTCCDDPGQEPCKCVSPGCDDHGDSLSTTKQDAAPTHTPTTATIKYETPMEQHPPQSWNWQSAGVGPKRWTLPSSVPHVVPLNFLTDLTRETPLPTAHHNNIYTRRDTVIGSPITWPHFTFPASTQMQQRPPQPTTPPQNEPATRRQVVPPPPSSPLPTTLATMAAA